MMGWYNVALSAISVFCIDYGWYQAVVVKDWAAGAFFLVMAVLTEQFKQQWRK